MPDPRQPLTAAEFTRKELSTQQDIHLLGRWLWGSVLAESEEQRLDKLEEWIDRFLTEVVGSDWRVKEALV